MKRKVLLKIEKQEDIDILFKKFGEYIDKEILTIDFIKNEMEDKTYIVENGFCVEFDGFSINKYGSVKGYKKMSKLFNVPILHGTPFKN